MAFFRKPENRVLPIFSTRKNRTLSEMDRPQHTLGIVDTSGFNNPYEYYIPKKVYFYNLSGNVVTLVMKSRRDCSTD